MTFSDWSSVLDRLHAGRDPERLALRITRMRASPHAFFRATAALHYAQVAARGDELPVSPLAWCHGDLHLENAGSYRGDNGLTYFDLEDVDEGALAPAAWDVLRFATAIRAALRSGAAWSSAEESALVAEALATYAAALREGTVRWVERATARGVVRRHLADVRGRSRRRFVASRTRGRGEARRLRTDDGRALPLAREDAERLAHWFAAFREADASRRGWRLLDAARRVTGLASLGRPRWVLLVDTGKPRLFDLRIAPASLLAEASGRVQPGWRDEAERIVTLARRLPVVPPAGLVATRVEGEGAVLRLLRPGADRLDVAELADAGDRRRVALTVASLAAWAHLRGAARQGADRPDALTWWGRERAAFVQLERLSLTLIDAQLAWWSRWREGSA